MHAPTARAMSVADTAQLAAMRRPFGEGGRSYAWFLRRKVAQVSAKKMASELGLHPQTLRAYEANRLTPRGEIAVNYLHLLTAIEKHVNVQEMHHCRRSIACDSSLASPSD